MADGATGETTALDEQLREFVGRPYGEPAVARDPVNVPMIRHLTDALGDRNPVYTDEEFAGQSVHGGIVAPPTALQVWTMRGLEPLAGGSGGSGGSGDGGDDAPQRLMSMLDAEGYIGVVATNCEQTYHRYLRPGDLVTVSQEVEAIAGPKATALGEGYFVTTLQTYRDQAGEVVGEMRFRILKFRPADVEAEDADEARAEGGDRAGAGAAEGNGHASPDAGATAAPAGLPDDFPPPPLDSRFWWEGVELGELRIQRCASCMRLRHPPRPSCPWCRSLERDHVVASGRGEVYSYVVHHHPPVPNRDHPFAVAVVELEEGTRLVGNVVGCEPAGVHVGMPVEVVFAQDHRGRTLPQWRPREEG